MSQMGVAPLAVIEHLDILEDARFDLSAAAVVFALHRQTRDLWSTHAARVWVIDPHYFAATAALYVVRTFRTDGIAI